MALVDPFRFLPFDDLGVGGDCFAVGRFAFRFDACDTGRETPLTETRMNMPADPHTILGIDRHATADQARDAYHTLVKDCHPDRNPVDTDAAERFKVLTEAYEHVLANAGDVARRARLLEQLERRPTTHAFNGIPQRKQPGRLKRLAMFYGGAGCLCGLLMLAVQYPRFWRRANENSGPEFGAVLFGVALIVGVVLLVIALWRPD